MFKIKAPEMRRYTISVILLMTAYVAILFGVNIFFRNSHPTGLSAYAAAILPALPIIGVFAVIGRLLVELRDEYVRMLLIRQIMFATGFTLSIATAWGFLEAFELVPHVEAYYVATLWFAGLGFGTCVNKLLDLRSTEEG
jgi:hypothetical protein